MPYELGPVVGTIGSRVESIPVSFVSPSASGLYPVLTVPVPQGKNTRVTLIVETTSATGTNLNSLPDLIIGGVEAGKMVSGACGASVVMDHPTLIQVRRTSTSNAYAPSFTGTVYCWPDD
ncbi:MAG: hypothetical protein ACI38U_03105 [Corynebacterium sp.]|uniref:hypothetical protein n=1 Tax=Corynebacterium sp. TaxID=1720 RepID=UPI003F09DC48